MQFVLKKDGSWGRKSFVDLADVDVVSIKVSLEKKDDNRDMEGGGTQNEIATKLQKNNGTEVEVIVDDPCHTATKEVESLNHLNTKSTSFVST